jgi:hypothetical protein
VLVDIYVLSTVIYLHVGIYVVIIGIYDKAYTSSKDNHNGIYVRYLCHTWASNTSACWR